MFGASPNRHDADMRIVVQVDGVDPPEGEVTDGDGSQAFQGWLGLMRVLANAIGTPIASATWTDGDSSTDATTSSAS